MCRLACILLIFFAAGSLFAQSGLREFEVREVTPPDKANIVQANSQYPDDALVIVYSGLAGLNFRSSLIVDWFRYDKQAGYYVLLVPPARQILHVSAPGFLEKRITEKEFTPGPKDVYAFFVAEQVAASYLPPWGEVTVQVKPADAELSINGKVVRLSEGEISFRGERGGLPPGTYKMVISKDKYRTEFRQLELKGGDQKLLSIDLQPYKGKLRVLSSPSGAEVRLNGEVNGQTPFEKELLVGKYEVSVRLKDHLDEVREVNIREEGMNEVKVDMFNYRRELQPLITGRKISLGFATASSAAGIWAMASTISNLRKYQSATTDASDLRQKVVTGAALWPVCMLAGASGFATWYYLGRKLDRKKQEFRISASPLPGGGIIQVTHTIGRSGK